MSITKRTSGYLVSVGSRSDRFRKVCKTLEEAKAVEAAELAERARQRLQGIVSQNTFNPSAQDGSNNITLLELWKRTKKLKWPNDSGVQAANAYRCIEFFGLNTLVLSINQKRLNDLVEELYKLGNSGSTINRKLSSLSMLFRVAEEDGILQHTFRMPRQKEGKNRKRVISPAEENRMYAVCERLGFYSLKDYIMFTLDTGFRKNESLNITTTDCYAGIARLHDGETKSGKGRMVPLTNRSIEIVRRRSQSGSNGRLFDDLNEYQLRRQWQVLKEAMGLENDNGFIVHALRHTCATRLGEAGKSALFIKEWMGWSSIMMAQVYVHLNIDSLRSGVEALSNAFLCE